LDAIALADVLPKGRNPKEIRLFSQKQAIIRSVAMLDLGLNSQHQNSLRSQSNFSQKTAHLNYLRFAQTIYLSSGGFCPHGSIYGDC
jgi:hypothetical protein